MSKKRLSPGANPGNALLLNEDQQWCCGQGETPADQCDFEATTTDDILNVRGVSIDGTDYYFPSALHPTATKEMESQIKGFLADAGYEPTDVSVTVSANNAVTVTAAPQQAVFGKLYYTGGLGTATDVDFTDSCNP